MDFRSIANDAHANGSVLVVAPPETTHWSRSVALRRRALQWSLEQAAGCTKVLSRAERQPSVRLLGPVVMGLDEIVDGEPRSRPVVSVEKNSRQPFCTVMASRRVISGGSLSCFCPRSLGL